MLFDSNAKAGIAALTLAAALGFASPSAFSQATVGLSWPGCADLKAGDFRKVKLDIAHPASPVRMAIAKDGRMFFASLDGTVWSWVAGGAVSNVANVTVSRGGVAFGLYGLTLDPAFETNGYMYLLYSANAVAGTPGLPAQLWRYPYRTATGKLDLAAGRKLLEYTVTKNGREDHSGGAMAWDAQGNLYVSTGDNAGSEQNFGNVDETKADYNSLRSAGNTNDLRGKILRIHPEPDGSYAIPAGNLFLPGTVGARPEIYAMGNRNPYTLHVDAVTGLLVWGDVGPQAGEFSATKGPAGMDEFNATRTAGNFGWPQFIGPNLAYNDFDYAGNKTGPLFDSLAPMNNSVFNTGLKALPRSRGSAIAYGKDGKHNPWPGFARGSAISITGPVYRYDGKNPSRIKLPPHLEGKWLISDTYQAWFRAVTLDASLEKAVAVNDFLPGLTFGGAGSIAVLDLRIGPDGALYVLEYSSRTVSRVEYAGTCLPDVTPSAVLPGAMGGKVFVLAPVTGPGSDGTILLPEGRAGFRLFDAGGREIFRYRRAQTGNLNVSLPSAMAGGALVRGLWLD